MIEEINKRLDEILEKLQNELDALQTKFNEQTHINKVIGQVLNQYKSLKTIDFDLLEDIINTLSINGIKFENINYKELYQIKQDLLIDFSDRTSSIDSLFDDLMKKLDLYVINQTREYAKLRHDIAFNNSEIEKYRKSKKLTDKIQVGEIITEEEMKLLDEISDGFLSEYIEELYILITKNNSYQMQKVINKARKDAKDRAIKLKMNNSKVNNRQEFRNEPTPITKEHILSDKEKKLINIAQNIIMENDISDKSFLTMVDGLNPIEILSYVDDGDIKKNIALVLNYVVLPLINSGKVGNIEKLLSGYIFKYDVRYKLDMLNRNDIMLNMQKAEDIINKFNELDNLHGSTYFGYISVLIDAYNNLKDAIYDDELFNSELFNFVYSEFLSILSNTESLELNISNDSNDEPLNSTKFYDGATNFIFFPEGIDFSEIIDDNSRLQGNHKNAVLNGLKKLSKDENILTSSNHKIKDANIERYRKLRRFKGNEYRIVYMVSKAEGLEKLFGRKMNIIFALDVGYGDTGDKSDFYSHAKRIYDKSENEINNAIKIFNSDDMNEINKLIGIQLSKLEEYIKSCQNNNIGTTHIKGGTQDE